MTKKLIIMCGLPGSGKSVIANRYAEAGALAVNKDAIRSMLHSGRYKYDEGLEPLVREATHTLLQGAMATGRDVVVDECNITKGSRRRLVAAAEIAGYKPVIYYVHTLPETCMARREMDHRGVSKYKWFEVILDMHRAFEVPTAAECELVVQ